MTWCGGGSIYYLSGSNGQPRGIEFGHLLHQVADSVVSRLIKNLHGDVEVVEKLNPHIGVIAAAVDYTLQKDPQSTLILHWERGCPALGAGEHGKHLQVGGFVSRLVISRRIGGSLLAGHLLAGHFLVGRCHVDGLLARPIKGPLEQLLDVKVVGPEARRIPVAVLLVDEVPKGVLVMTSPNVVQGTVKDTVVEHSPHGGLGFGAFLFHCNVLVLVVVDGRSSDLAVSQSLGCHIANRLANYSVVLLDERRHLWRRWMARSRQTGQLRMKVVEGEIRGGQI